MAMAVAESSLLLLPMPRIAACTSSSSSPSSCSSSSSVRSRVPVQRNPRKVLWRKSSIPAIQASESRSVDQSTASATGASGSSPPQQSHFDLLQRMTENSSTSQGARVKTIRDQLVQSQSDAEDEPEEEMALPLATGENALNPPPSPPELTISQRRNIRRQDYLNKVSERNDAPFFAIVAAIVLLPPLLILTFAVASGYVQLFP